MRNENESKNFIKNDAGSTLLTVLVAISFVLILTMIIQGTSLMNLRMKSIDRKNKNEFYYAEKALNDIYTGVGQEMALIAGDEYDKVFNKVGTVDSATNTDFGLAEASEKEFKKNFISAAKNKFPTDNAALIAKLQGYITDSSRGKVESVGEVKIEKKDGSETTVASTGTDAPVRLRIKDLKVSSADTEGFQSVVSTDLVVYIPSVDFFGSNVDITDYGIVANKGIYVNGDVDITGNVYGGIHAKTEYETEDKAMYELTTGGFDQKGYDAAGTYGGINIKDGSLTVDGNYIVSKGNINLAGNAPTFEVGNAALTDANLPNLWFDSLRILKGAKSTSSSVKPKVEIYANSYALNDLELNADDSEVIIKGNYYGYNDKTLPYKDKDHPEELIFGYSSKREDAESSAIIINGSSCKLNMEDISTLVLMGKAYVDFTTNEGSVDMSDPSAEPVVATAEGIALKTNQQLYLLPIEFLNCPNPIGGDEFRSNYGGKFDINTSKADLRKWFGYKYVKPAGVSNVDDTTGDTNKAGVSDENAYKEIYKTYKVTIGTGASAEVVYYAYLDFNKSTWLPQKDPSTGKLIGFTFQGEGKETDPPVGTNGSVSSKAAFFWEIMAATTPAVTSPTITEPSEARLKERIEKSMTYSYFDLDECVVGDSAHLSNTVLYARNAIVSYENNGTGIQSNLLGNTVGMVRFAAYPQNMFHRYQWLCTSLDGRENVNLNDDPGSPTDNSVATKDNWEVSSGSSDAPPLSHFVMFEKMSSGLDTSTSISNAEAEGLKRTAYGDCIIKKGNFTIGSGTSTVGNTFKGIAIVDGDITVEDGYNVYGLLMATGTITFKGSSKVTYDKGLIQSRIEKEMQLVKQFEGAASLAYKDYYLITYLSKTTRVATDPTSSKLLYEVTPGTAIKKERIEADYNEFVQYENWKKGAE